MGDSRRLYWLLPTPAVGIPIGLQVTKVSKVITYTQSAWMRPYIEYCTGQRKQAKNEFEKDFWKLM